MDINVLFCIDEKFWQHLGVAITSLLLSNPQSRFRIVVASAAPLNEQRSQEIATLVTTRGNATLQTIYYQEALQYQDLPVHDHLTFAAYLRLFMAEFLPSDIDRILYLDTDLLVVDDIRDLWRIDLGDAYLGAAPEPYDRAQREPLNFGPQDFYFNSGVMLVNVQKWRADIVLPSLIDFARQNPDKLPSVDQDVLNSVFRGKILNIGYEWNWQALFVRMQPSELGMSRAKYLQLKKSPHLVHYTSRYKPWYYRWEPHYKSFYYRVLAQTPWAGYVPPDKSLRNLPTKIRKVAQRNLEWYLPSVARKLRNLSR